MSISKGNSKLGKVPNISLPPGKACVNCDGCIKDCYALKSYRMYPTVRNSWNENLASVLKSPVTYFSEIGQYLSKHSPTFFRWHVSGDILDQDYLNNMFSLARTFPHVKFLAFTKAYSLDYGNKPGNLEIVFSAWPGMQIPETSMPIAWMQDGTETRQPVDALECPGNCETCGMCFSLSETGKDIVFHKH